MTQLLLRKVKLKNLKLLLRNLHIQILKFILLSLNLNGLFNIMLMHTLIHSHTSNVQLILYYK